MFLILISCNNSILPGRFYSTDKRLCVSPPASPPSPPQLAHPSGSPTCGTGDSTQLRKTIVIPQLSALGNSPRPDVREQSGVGRPETHRCTTLSISTPFHFPFIFQLRAPSNLLSAAVPAP